VKCKLKGVKVEYSTQDRFGYFGARWFCAITALVIAFEHFLKRRATMNELDMMRGRWMRLGNRTLPPPVYDSNYKNHKAVFSGGMIGAGWGELADPEAHGFIRDWTWTAAEIADVMKVDLSKFPSEDYGLIVVDVDGNPYDANASTHFLPLYKGEIISNPDPNLEGYPEVERRDFPI
jgi:hypothetical protein